jgi:hypothetical protein
LLIKTDDGGVDDFGCEFCWHVRCSFLDSLCPACTADPILHLPCH